VSIYGNNAGEIRGGAGPDTEPAKRASDRIAGEEGFDSFKDTFLVDQGVNQP